MFKTAIQTNAWSDNIHRNQMDRLLAEVAAAGFMGIEIGAHRLDLSQPQRFQEHCRSHGLMVAALHTHGELYTTAEHPAILERVEAAARFCQAVGAPQVLMSGKPREGGKTAADLAAEVTLLNAAGAICRQYGRLYCYHNHYWEIQDNLRELRTLREETDPALVFFAIDVAWVKRGGTDPAQIVDEFLPRLAYLHFKDTKDERWTDLGQGEVDFPAILEVIQTRRDLWLAYERDEPLEHAAESARVSGAYLKQLLATLGG